MDGITTNNNNMSYNHSLDPDSNYPPMSQSDWDAAPWNQREPEPYEVTVEAEYTIKAKFPVDITDYEVEHCPEDGKTYYDTTNSDFETAYEEQYYNPAVCLSRMSDLIRKYVPKEAYGKEDIERLLASAEGWRVTYQEVTDR